MNASILTDRHFYQFLMKAKQTTYAGEGALTQACRPGSIDLSYEEGAFKYLDSYLGGHHFIGEEIVWYNGKAVWGMNYYGRLLIDKAPSGFISFLKASLMQVPEEMPYRGPEEFICEEYCYTCQVEGELPCYRGKETIFFNGQKIHQLYFHGGEITT